jgi:hypothetical protein
MDKLGKLDLLLVGEDFLNFYSRLRGDFRGSNLNSEGE